MGWVRISDDFYDHVKFADVTPLGVALWVTSLAWCNRNLTDGVIPRSVAARLIDTRGIALYETDVERGQEALWLDAVGELTHSGLWVDEGKQYRIHDYLRFQPSGEKIRAERKKTAERQEAWRNRNRNEGSNGQDNGVTNEDVTGAPNPNPTTQTQEAKSQDQKSSSRKRSANGTRIPEDFTVTPEMVAWAAENCPDVDGRYATAQFVDYWAGESGAKATKLDWVRTWQTWMRREQKQAPRKTNGYQSPTDANIQAFLGLNTQRAIGDGK
jgi:hypothetical protein